MQVDGEPCKLAASCINITLRNQANMVQKTKRRNSMPLLNEYVCLVQGNLGDPKPSNLSNLDRVPLLHGSRAWGWYQSKGASFTRLFWVASPGSSDFTVDCKRCEQGAFQRISAQHWKESEKRLELCQPSAAENDSYLLSPASGTGLASSVMLSTAPLAGGVELLGEWSSWEHHSTSLACPVRAPSIRLTAPLAGRDLY